MPATQVILIEKPTSLTLRDLPLTVGKAYDLLYRDGSNVCITTDDPRIDAHIWRGRVRPVDEATS